MTTYSMPITPTSAQPDLIVPDIHLRMRSISHNCLLTGTKLIVQEGHSPLACSNRSAQKQSAPQGFGKRQAGESLTGPAKQARLW